MPTRPMIDGVPRHGTNIEHDDQRDEERAEQEHDQGHPRGQAAVGRNRVRAISLATGSARDEPVVVEQLADLVDAWRRPAAGSGRTRRGRPRRARCPGRATPSSSSRQRGRERGARPRLDGGLDRGVELVEAGPRASSATSYWPSPRIRTIMTGPPSCGACCSAAQDVAASSSPSIACGWLRALEPRQLGLDVGLRAHRVELAGDVVAGADLADVVERAGGDQLVDGAGAGLHLRRLVLGPLDGQADVAHLLADAGHRLVDPGLRLGGGVRRLDRLLAGAEGLDLGLQPLLGEGELLLLALELRVLRLEVG